MNYFLLSAILIIASCAHREEKKVEAEKAPLMAEPVIAFIVTEGISHPESALYSHEHKAIFVSNVTSGNPMETKRVGYISKIGTDGKVIKAKWVTNLKAPKGLAIVGNYMFVSDVNEMVKIDITKAKIVKTWKVKGAKFLNDVVADNMGNVYVSDMNDNVIHKITNNELKEWLRTPDLRGPNGLYTDGEEHIILAQWGSDVDATTWVAKNPGHLTALSLKTPNTKINEDLGVAGHFDGIDSDKNGNLIVSDWMNGDVWQVMKNGKGFKIHNFAQGTADISVAKELGLLLVPQMNDSKLIAVELK